MIDSLTKNDFISISEFRLKWRFTEDEYNRLPEKDLSLIQPLSNRKAMELYRYSQKYLGNATLLRSEFGRVESLKIANNYAAVRDWLTAKQIDSPTKVAVSWDNTDCVITLWRIFCRYWDDFCYPNSDDILIWSSAENWFLHYGHHEIFEFGLRKP